MTYTDRKVDDIVINRLTRAQYDELKAGGRLVDEQLYVITDETDGFSNVYLNGKRTDLSVYRVSNREYEELVRTNGVVASALYVVNGDVEDMYGERIVNVGTPTDPSDAATKAYVDAGLSAKAGKAATLSGYGITDAYIQNGKITLGLSTITPLTAHQSLTNYYNKTQVNKISSDLSSAMSDQLQSIIRRWTDE